MGMEQLNIERDTQIEVQGYTVKFTPAENPTYSYVKLSKGDIVLEAVALNKTGEVSKIEVTDAPRELIQRANLMKSEVYNVVKEALGIETTEIAKPDSVSDPEWEQIVADEKEIQGLDQVLATDVPVHNPAKKRNMQATHLSKSRGDENYR
jgi:hypothetical protein